MKDLEQIKNQFNQAIAGLENIKQLEEQRVYFLGKKGVIAELMQDLKQSSDKKKMGQEINELKNYFLNTISELRLKLEEQLRDETLKQSAVDVTIDNPKYQVGKKNILLKTREEIENIFMNLGYEVALGQEIETDYYNFEALNLDEFHPARDMQDTFYFNPNLLLRTHTSNIQTRVLEQNPNRELKIICPGSVYRRDDDDATHSHQFMQIEGLVVVHNDSPYTASLSDLKTTLTKFVREIFNNEQLHIRLRPSYFPFTEPSVEVDITCSSCLGSGCKMCKKTGWIEVLGAGIVNPKVLEINGFDSEQYSGFAFGIGVERIALLKYNIDDIRKIYQNNNEFLKQF